MMIINKAQYKQYKLDLLFKPIFTEGAFFVDDSNREAFHWINEQKSWQASILHGPAGCGKTHLAHLWRDIRKDDIQYIDVAEDFNDFADILIKIRDDKDRKHRSIVLDNFPAIFKSANSHLAQEDENSFNNELNYQMLFPNSCEIKTSPIPQTSPLEEAFLHFYNWAKSQQIKILLIARTRPSSWDISIPDLASRLMSIPSIEIKMPGDDLMKSVIKKLFLDVQIVISDEIIEYIFHRINRSFISAKRAVSFINNMAIAQKRILSIGFVKEIVSGS